MQIRSLTWRGLPMWPPEWTILDQGAGEEGVLEAVDLRHHLKTTLISVVANHLGEIRKGIMVLEDSSLLEVVYHNLKQHVGRPLAEIGDLEIDLIPSSEKRSFRQVRPYPPLPYKSAAE